MTAAFSSSPRSGSPYGTWPRQKRQKPTRQGPRTELGAKPRSRSPVREAAPKPAAASSSYYEETDEEAPGPPTQAAAGEFLPAAPMAKAGAQLQEPSQPSVLPKPEEPRTPAAKALTKEEPAFSANPGEEAKETEVHGGAGEALPVATATKEESDRPREGQPTGSQVTGSGELLPGPSADAGQGHHGPRKGRGRRRRTYQARLRPHARSLCSPSGSSPELSAGERAETVHPPATQREGGRLGPP